MPSSLDKIFTRKSRMDFDNSPPMKKLYSLFFALFLLPSLLFAQDFKDKPVVCFTPGGDCTNLIIKEIDQAKQTILVQAYSFTSAPIAKAILEASKRGVKVQVILDKSQKTQKYSSVDFFVHTGVPTYIDSQHAIAHNKIIIIDSSTLITGSFNFTKAAQEKNAENLLVLHDPVLISLYKKNWTAHLQHSESML